MPLEAKILNPWANSLLIFDRASNFLLASAYCAIAGSKAAADSQTIIDIRVSPSGGPLETRGLHECSLDNRGSATGIGPELEEPATSYRSKTAAPKSRK